MINMTIFEVFSEIVLVIKTFYKTFTMIKKHRDEKVKAVLAKELPLQEKMDLVSLLFKEEKENRQKAAKKLQDFFKERYK